MSNIKKIVQSLILASGLAVAIFTTYNLLKSAPSNDPISDAGIERVVDRQNGVLCYVRANAFGTIRAMSCVPTSQLENK